MIGQIFIFTIIEGEPHFRIDFGGDGQRHIIVVAVQILAHTGGEDGEVAYGEFHILLAKLDSR